VFVALVASRLYQRLFLQSNALGVDPNDSRSTFQHWKASSIIVERYKSAPLTVWKRTIRDSAFGRSGEEKDYCLLANIAE
jgi:hypothetical protein